MSYIFDTNTWIGFAWRDFPKETFVTVWERVEAGVNNGSILTLDVVFMELQRQDDELAKWMKQKNASTEGFVLSSDQEIQAIAAELINRYELKDDADPFLVAAAKKFGLTVVTKEKPRNYPREKPPKIPNLCQILNIPCITPLEFFKKLGWTF